MPKTVTLRLKDDIYDLFTRLAGQENRPLSNFIIHERSGLRKVFTRKVPREKGFVCAKRCSFCVSFAYTVKKT